MADLAATDITYTQRNAAFTRSDQGYRRVFDLTFGDGTKTYPTGGIPITSAKLGCLTSLLLVELAQNGITATGNRTWVWDQANGTLRAFIGATEATGGSTAISATTLRVEAVGY